MKVHLRYSRYQKLLDLVQYYIRQSEGNQSNSSNCIVPSLYYVTDCQISLCVASILVKLREGNLDVEDMEGKPKFLFLKKEIWKWCGNH